MRTVLTAVLLGAGTLCAAVPAEASWLSESFHRGGISVYVAPSQYAHRPYVAPSYDPPTYVPAPYVLPSYASPAYVVPSYVVPNVSYYQTRPVYPAYPYSTYHSHDFHHHYR